MDRWRVIRTIVLYAWAGLALVPRVSAAEEAVRLHAAGSLRGALTEVAAAFTRAYGITVRSEFGASGLLRERLERGEAGDVFASANMEHPLLLSRPGKLGTSTPKADPSGDYAWEVFRKADGLRPGSREALEKKALQLTGGPTSPRLFILSPEGQEILARHGFAAPTKPAP